MVDALMEVVYQEAAAWFSPQSVIRMRMSQMFVNAEKAFRSGDPSHQLMLRAV